MQFLYLYLNQFVFLLLIYSSSLHIADKLLSEICFANVFSYFIACLFNQLLRVFCFTCFVFCLQHKALDQCCTTELQPQPTVFICIYLWGCGVHVTSLVWRSEDNFQELILPLSHHAIAISYFRLFIECVHMQWGCGVGFVSCTEPEHTGFLPVSGTSSVCSFTSAFPLDRTCVSFLCLIALVGASSTVWNKMHFSHLVPDLGEVG